MRRLSSLALAAIQFLTVIPVPSATANAGEAALFFPVTGALLGVSAGVVLFGVGCVLGRSIGALLAVSWLLIVTGCLHEDGLADVADAVRAGRTRQKMMNILKDSRIGAYGAVALILSIGLRWQALARSGANPLPGLLTALAFLAGRLLFLLAQRRRWERGWRNPSRFRAHSPWWSGRWRSRLSSQDCRHSF